jgi:hypothetical protein
MFCAAIAITGYGGQEGSVAPRTTTERPNVTAQGLEQTLSGVLMDAACSAIAEGRSDLTRTARIAPPRNDVSSTVRRRTERPASTAAPVSENTIPDKYRDCRVKAATTSFAFFVNDTVYVLDQLSNQMMQEHMLKAKSEVSDTKWLTRTLVGTSTSDNVLSLRTVRK